MKMFIGGRNETGKYKNIRMTGASSRLMYSCNSKGAMHDYGHDDECKAGIPSENIACNRYTTSQF